LQLVRSALADRVERDVWRARAEVCAIDRRRQYERSLRSLSRRFLLPTLCAQCAAGRHCCSTCVCHERGCLQEAQAAAENSGAEVYAKRRMHAHTLTRTPAHELSHCSCAHARTRTRTHAAPAHARARSHPPAHPVSRTRLLPDASACAPINSARRSSGCGSR
jgi:hypothetical protein